MFVDGESKNVVEAIERLDHLSVGTVNEETGQNGGVI